ncbi:NfeD family protein [Methylotenera sp. G11]|uniref:NfeD family protein n=1 Tax=Methylotenera sp. G11 TaxID=1506585 RepID=UPI000645759F|nr:NfeD family protein [Methylotenera sp. G11]
MIEAMWAWAVLGIVLLAVEIMITGTIYTLWFSISALCVAIMLWLFPGTSYAVQFTVFAALSLGSLAIWRRHYKKTDTSYRVGQAQGEEIGRVGTVIIATSPTHNGTIRFAQGLMGSREWIALSDEPIEVGVDATVVAVEGNTLRIAKIINN